MHVKPAPTLLALAALLGGCGSSQSQAPTVTVTAPAPTASTGATPPPASAPARPTSINSTPRTPTVPPAATRTAPAPAFATGETPAGGELPAAVAKIRGLGFTPVSTAAFDSGQTLRVLLGARSGSGGAHAQQAFFFDAGKYLGTDAAATSGQITITGHGDTDATLRYAIYRPADSDCCPTGTARTVRFTLDGGHLVALDPIPPVAARR